MIRLFRLLAVLPLGFLQAAGAVLGWAVFAASPTYRRRFLAHAAQAGYSFGQVRPAVAAAGRLVAELPRLWFGAAVQVQWEGAALVEAARAAGRGVILLTPHLGCFEVAAQSYAERFGPITVLYRPARKPWLRPLVDTARVRAGLAVAPATLAGVRQLVRSLRAGQTVGLLPDQVPPQGLGVWAPFFDRPAYTMTLPARLAQTGAAVLFLWVERLPRGRGYCVHVRAAPPAVLDAQAAAAAAACNVQLECLVRECPAQYLWGYARYKTPRAALTP